ncbi:unnamed protein product [Mytilus edulis]|uniref:Uncharacterized protein n=1 Tax=Mytilus edulis TaxID=6550 RepID=A0A8S3VNU4_MYTED|nr:unnamed protein product [Mytilus edulis]
MIELDEGYKLTVKTVKHFHAEVEKTFYKLRNDYLNWILRNHLKNRNMKQRDKNSETGKSFKNEVEKHTQNLLTDLDLQKKCIKKSLHDEANQTQKIKRFRKSQERVLRADRKQKVEPLNTKFKGLPQYVPGKQPILIAQHGELAEFEENKEDRFEFQVLQQFKTELQIIENLVCCEDGTLWVNHFFSYKLQKIQLNKESVQVQVLKNINTTSFTIALLPTGDLLISLMEPVLQILSNATGEIKQTTYRCSALQTIAVHVTKANQIILGVTETGESFPVKGPRQVIVMDMDGREKKFTI